MLSFTLACPITIQYSVGQNGQMAVLTSHGTFIFICLYVHFFVIFYLDIGSNLGTFSLMAAAMGRNAVAVDAVYYNLAHIFAR